MAKRSSLRASDADRDRVTERLRQAAAEGRLMAHELEERIAKALRARTYGDLDAVVDDLPRPTEFRAQQRSRPTRVQVAASHPKLTVLSVILGALLLTGMLAVVAIVAVSAFLLVPLVLLATPRGRRLRRVRQMRQLRRGGYGGRYVRQYRRQFRGLF